MNNEEILVTYVIENLLPDPYFKGYVRKNPSFIFALINDSRIDLQDIALVKALISLQKRRNLIFKNEITSLNSFCNDFIGMKGYFLQLLYYPNEYVRLFGDIDILSRKRNQYFLFKKLKNVGFKVDKHKGFYRQIIHSQFIISLLRNIYTRNNKHIRLISPNSTVLELHTNINDNCSKTSRTMFDIERMFDESVYKRTSDLNFHVFSPEDNLLYLMFHTINHLPFIDLNGNKLSINLQNFYDVAQIISNEQIDWNLFCNKAKQYNICHYISFYIRLFSDIYVDVIPAYVNEFLENQSKSTNFIWKEIYLKAKEVPPSSIILGNYKNNPKIMLFYEKSKESTNSEKVWKQFYTND